MARVRVSKFGGSSLADFQSIQQAVAIVIEQSLSAAREAQLIVVSACYGVTDQLTLLGQKAASGQLTASSQLLSTIIDRHRRLAQELALAPTPLCLLESLFDELQSLWQRLTQGLQPQLLDWLLSLGERLSSLLFVGALSAHGVEAPLFDVRGVLRTNSQFGLAEPFLQQIALLAQQQLRPLLCRHHVVVTQGFIGSTAAGETTTLGRGGSDYSAALLAEALEATQVQIWTDVPGIFSCDPRLLASSYLLPELAIDEAAELTAFGAKVLHPATLWPVMRGAIPLFVGSTFAPEQGGTWVRPKLQASSSVRALAVRQGQLLITVAQRGVVNNFLSCLFGVLDRHGVAVDLISTSEVRLALAVDRRQRITRELLDELGALGTVEVEESLALVALIGSGLKGRLGIVAELFSWLEPFSVRLICHGASDHNICLLVAEERLEEVIQLLHRQLIGEQTRPWSHEIPTWEDYRLITCSSRSNSAKPAFLPREKVPLS